MVSRIYSPSALPACKKISSLLPLLLIVFLTALPAITQAATPWYSHGKSHTLTLTQDGKVWALGSNNFGQLGTGVYGGNAGEPTVIKGLDGVIAVLAGTNERTCQAQHGFLPRLHD